MSNKKLWKLMAAMFMSLVLAFAMTACGGEEEAATEEDAEAPATTELSQEDMDVLLQQVAEKDLTKQYEGYLQDELLANAEVFGIDQEEQIGKAYVYLNEGEYVAVKDKGYLMSGGSGEAIIEFESTDDGPVLKEVTWSADGSEHDAWMEENFPAEYLKASQEYLSHNDEGISPLGQELDKKAGELLGVTVDNENLLEVDTEKGTYKIIKTTESGDPANDDYEFNTEVIEEGNISDLNS